MSLTNIVKTLVLDVYDHDQTQATIKAIALDSKTRYVQATLTYMGADYPVSETATVTLTVLRPDKVGALFKPLNSTTVLPAAALT